MVYDGDEFEQPQDVIPGYETDLAAIGTNRQVDHDKIDNTPWHELFPKEHVDAVDLPDDVEVRP